MSSIFCNSVLMPFISYNLSKSSPLVGSIQDIGHVSWTRQLVHWKQWFLETMTVLFQLHVKHQHGDKVFNPGFNKILDCQVMLTEQSPMSGHKPVAGWDARTCTHKKNKHTIPYHTIPYHTIPYHTYIDTHCSFWEFVNFNDDVLVHAWPDSWVHHRWETGETNVPVWLLV